MILRTRTWRALALSLLLPLFLVAGCASTSPRDPLEPMNRAIYRFNDAVDTALIRPLAEGYRAVLPSFVRTGISNFFGNLNDVLIALNNLLQGKVAAAASDTGRVLINTTAGVGGLFDVASNMGLEKHNEDFGQTLGFWGIGDGAYLMVPFLGPSSIRDSVGRFVDAKGDPVGYLNDIPWRNSLWGLRTVNQRAELLDTSKILETAALDPYEFLRDGYLQRRRNLVYDGSPPREKFEDENGDKPNSDKPDADKARSPSGASNPFPVSAEYDSSGPGTPLPSGERLTPARAEALQTAPETRASPAPPRVVRVWTPATER